MVQAGKSETVDTSPALINDDVDVSQGGNERRHYMRYRISLRVQLISSDCLPMQFQTTDVSIAGWHFECDQWAAQHLTSNGELAMPATGKQFTARFKVPMESGEHRMLTLMTKVVGMQRLAQDKYRVSMRFEHFGGKSHDLLQEFLESL